MRIPRPATIRKVSHPGDERLIYLVTGVACDGEPFTKPHRRMTIERWSNERRWQLLVDDQHNAWCRDLRSARYQASAVDDHWSMQAPPEDA